MMDQTPQPTFFEKLSIWAKSSITLRLITIGILILVLMIPLSMVKHLIWEREARKSEAVREISNIWGGSQLLSGPVIAIPYHEYSQVYHEKSDTYRQVKNIRHAHFLPETLNVNGIVNPEIRYRGIYEAIVYQSSLGLEGSFSPPDFSLLNIDDENILWNEATLSIGITDLRSIKDEIKVNWNNTMLAFDPDQSTIEINASGITTQLENLKGDSTNQSYTFSIQMELNGSTSLKFAPLGKKTKVNLASTWPDPSFTGAFLPNDKEINDEGFSAEWEVFHLNRPFPQQFSGAIQGLHNSTFGVELIVPANDYQQSTRAAKYAILLITLTFAIFFFAQVMRQISIHPIQYLIVGFALCLFYTLLVAISEHIGFQKAYIISGTSTIAAIVMYVQGFFKSNKMTMLTGGLLGMIYAFIYIIIQLQDYALIMGSIGLFMILAGVMYFTRKIEWTTMAK